MKKYELKIYTGESYGHNCSYSKYETLVSSNCLIYLKIIKYILGNGEIFKNIV